MASIAVPVLITFLNSAMAGVDEDRWPWVGGHDDSGFCPASLQYGGVLLYKWSCCFGSYGNLRGYAIWLSGCPQNDRASTGLLGTAQVR